MAVARSPISIALALVVAALSAFVACRPKPSPPEPPPPIADLSGLQPGWNTIEAGGATTCSDGSPYQFLVRPGDPAHVVFYLQGGGGCFDGRTCDPDVDPTYTVNLYKRETNLPPLFVLVVQGERIESSLLFLLLLILHR